MIAEETRHPGLAHTTLTHIQVAELLTPAGEIFREGDVSVRNFLFLRKMSFFGRLEGAEADKRHFGGETGGKGSSIDVQGEPAMN